MSPSRSNIHYYIEKAFNSRMPPKDAITLSIVTIPMAVLDYSSGVASLHFDNLWDNTLDILDQWMEYYGMVIEFDDSLYTWAMCDSLTDSLIISLFIHIQDDNISTMFKLSCDLVNTKPVKRIRL